MALTYSQAVNKLSSIGQTHLLNFWNELTLLQQTALMQQVDQLNIDTINKLRTLLKQKHSRPTKRVDPFTDFSRSGNKADDALGKKIIAEGKIGTLVMAGGQGTRLRFNGPKGLFPVSPVKHKTLFQLIAEKTRAASQQAGISLPIAFMTSPLNHLTTLQYFEANGNFGLNSEQISLFPQGMLPMMDDEGNLFLEEKDKIIQGPDGNGSSLYHFVKEGLWDKWHAKGIRYMNFILIDNPLADPFDAELIGFHVRNQCEVTVKCCLRENAAEKVGVLVQQDHRVRVVEYNEMPLEERFSVLSNGQLKHACANLSLFCFSMEQVKAFADSHEEMPFHSAHKLVEHNKEKKGWKFEKFIFDVLPLSRAVKALLYPRELCFAPLKNAEGADSLATVQAALQKLDCLVIEKITGLKPPERPFELAPEFHYPPPELLAKWKGKALPPQDYIKS